MCIRDSADTGTKYDLIARNPNASFEMDRGHGLILDDEHGNCTMTCLLYTSRCV